MSKDFFDKFAGIYSIDDNEIIDEKIYEEQIKPEIIKISNGESDYKSVKIYLKPYLPINKDSTKFSFEAYSEEDLIRLSRIQEIERITDKVEFTCLFKVQYNKDFKLLCDRYGLYFGTVDGKQVIYLEDYKLRESSLYNIIKSIFVYKMNSKILELEIIDTSKIDILDNGSVRISRDREALKLRSELLRELHMDVDDFQFINKMQIKIRNYFSLKVDEFGNRLNSCEVKFVNGNPVTILYTCKDELLSKTHGFIFKQLMIPEMKGYLYFHISDLAQMNSKQLEKYRDFLFSNEDNIKTISAFK